MVYDCFTNIQSNFLVKSPILAVQKMAPKTLVTLGLQLLVLAQLAQLAQPPGWT
jgi:hypothetical protein